LLYNSPRGTSDYFGNDLKYINHIDNVSREIFELCNYSEITTPHFEHTEVFSRGIGENSEIVKKEMFTFLDKKGRSLTLRPEGTASIVRAVVENKLYSHNLPIKLFYCGSMFRYERPQKGRMREFKQIGIEAIGSSSPAIDAEAIWLLNLIFKNLGFKNLLLKINSIGCSECRKSYMAILEDYLSNYLDKLCSDCKERYKKNTLRIFDCKVNTCKEVLKEAPVISDYLCEECSKHLGEVLKILNILDIEYLHDKSLVRGFDYYTRTIFEIVSKDIESSQNALGGGGRYDNLIAEFGGPDLASVGFAIGVERTMLLMKELDINIDNRDDGAIKVFVISMKSDFNSYLFNILRFLRQHKIICDSNFNIKNIGKDIKAAKSLGFTHVIVIGESESDKGTLSIKDLDNFSQNEFDFLNDKTGILNYFNKQNLKESRGR